MIERVSAQGALYMTPWARSLIMLRHCESGRHEQRRCTHPTAGLRHLSRLDGVALLEAIGHGAGQQEYVYDAGLNDSGYDWKQYCRICPELQRQQDASAIG